MNLVTPKVTPIDTLLALILRWQGNGARTLAILYDPEIRFWRGATFKLNGWEIIEWKGEGRQLVVQEWACQIEGF